MKSVVNAGGLRWHVQVNRPTNQGLERELSQCTYADLESSTRVVSCGSNESTMAFVAG